MIATILFIRHAATVANENKIYADVTDVAISKTGNKQIEILTEQLKDIKIDKIYTGPLTRRIHTIESIAKIHHITPGVEPDLIEMNLGIAIKYHHIYDKFELEEMNKILSSI